VRPHHVCVGEDGAGGDGAGVEAEDARHALLGGPSGEAPAVVLAAPYSPSTLRLC
jgi:hypothetical protein